MISFQRLEWKVMMIHPAIRNAFYLKNNELILAVIQHLFKPIIYKSKNININLFTKEK